MSTDADVDIDGLAACVAALEAMTPIGRRSALVYLRDR
jgi:hypothetical protein